MGWGAPNDAQHELSDVARVQPPDVAGPVSNPTAPAAQSASAKTAEYLSDIDTQLMLQVRNGDREAAGMLIRRNYERVARYIGRVVRQQAVIEDLTQDVFAQILTHAGRYEPAARFSTWAYRVATNTALKFMKSKYERSKTRDGDEQLQGKPDRDGLPDAHMNLAELKGCVQDAIGQLPPNQKAATILFECEGLTYEQIASVMSVTEDAVRALLSRARAALRDRLGGLLEE